MQLCAEHMKLFSMAACQKVIMFAHLYQKMFLLIKYPYQKYIKITSSPCGLLRHSSAQVFHIRK